MDPVFEISDRKIDGVSIVSVAGEIDVTTAPSLREHLNQKLLSGSETLVVDLLDVGFLDSTALGVLIGANNRSREAGGRLRLVIERPHILKVFEITSLTELFSIYETVDDAVTV